MLCLQYGNELEKTEQLCLKNGYWGGKKVRNINKARKKKRAFMIIATLILLVGIIILGIYKWNGSYTSESNENTGINKFTSEDTRLPVDPDTYGKETPEEVFVEFIHAGCDGDAERLMHTLPPDMLDSILAVPVGYEDYQVVLECFENYESDMWGLLSGNWENWECRIEQIETYGTEEIKKINDDWKEQFNYSLNKSNNLEITGAKRINYRMRFEDGHEEYGAVQVYKIDGRWYINIYSC